MADKLTLKIELDADGVVQSVNGIKAAQDDLIQTNESAVGSWTELNSAIELGIKAFNVVSGAAKVAISAISEGSSVGDVAESFDKMAAKAGTLSDVLLEELSAATGGTVDNLTLMRETLEATRAGATPDEFIKLTEAARVLAEETGGNLTDELDQLSNAFETGRVMGLKNKLGVIDLEQAQEKLAQSLGVSADKLSKEGQILAARQAILSAASKKTQEFGVITDDAGDAIASITSTYTNFTNKVKQTFGTNEDLNKALQQLARIIKEIDFGPIISGLTSIAEYSAKAITAIITVGKGIVEIFDAKQSGMRRGLSDTEIGQILSEAVTKTEELKGKAEEAGGALGELGTKGGKGLIDLSAVAEDAAKRLEDLNKAINDNLEDRIRLQERLIQNTEKEIDLTIEKIKQEQESSFSFGIASSLGGPATMAEFGRNLSNALQNALVTALSGGNKQDIFGGLGRELGAQFGPLGEFLGGELGVGIADGLDHAFGGNRDAGHKARNAVNKFFHDLLEDSSIRVSFAEGIIAELDAIQFDESAIRAGGWADAMQAAGETASEGFTGAGIALQEILGISEAIGPQIGAALFDNLNGNLNDLQILLQQTGFSLEQMKTSIVDAFKAGELTALDTTSALQGVQEVMTDGIPGAIGDVSQAFENLKKGGVNSLDAMGDLAIELQEKFPGVTLTLEDLRAELIAQGKPLEEVDALMTAFAENGVDSLQELIDIGDELAISVLANLQQSATAFGDSLSKTADDIKGLNEQLNELDGKTVDTYVKVHVSQEGGDIPSGNIGEPG